MPNKISIYKRRKTGEKINVALDFLRQNWRTALRFSIYLLLPVALFHSMGVFSVFRATFSSQVNSTDMSILLSLFFLGLSSCLIYSMILTMFQYYMGSSDGDLSMLSFNDIKGLLWHNLKKVAILTIPTLAALVLCFLLTIVFFVVPFFSFFIILALALLVFILMMAPIFSVLEDSSAINSIKRSFSHASQSWGNLLGLMIAMFLVVMVIQSVTAMPMLFFAFTSQNLTPSSGLNNDAWQFIYDAIMYLFIIAQTFFSYLCMALVVTTMVYHYGSEAGNQDDIGLGDDIENFANL